jgi:hypothetical protein
MQLVQPICYCFCVYKDLEFFLRFLNRASKIDQGVVKSPKCRLYILMANPNYKDILYQVRRSAADLIYSLFFTCCKFVHFFILLLLVTLYSTFSHLSFLINSLLYKQNFIWSKATKKIGWYVQFLLIHVVNFMTCSNTYGSVHHNCDVPFKNMVFHIEFHISSNWIDEVPNKYHQISLQHSLHLFLLITTWAPCQYYIVTSSPWEFQSPQWANFSPCGDF